MATEALDKISEAREEFDLCAEASEHNRETGLEDIRFAREGKQWPDGISKEREADGRPMLTINKLPAFLRQVVNDARQNKPSISVHPVDDGADPETAQVIGDLIRNIEYTSDADVAYDTGVESATGNGFGYWRVAAEYSYDDSFDQDLKIKRIRNPFSVYEDPYSQAADSSDWDIAFITDRLGKNQYEKQWGKKAKISWDDQDAWGGANWREGDSVTIAERWKREDIDRKILLVGQKQIKGAPPNPNAAQPFVIGKDEFEADEEWQAALAAGLIEVKRERTAKSCKVTQDIMSGAEILETNAWPGRFIPIIPIYGDEFDIEGKVYRRSLIHDAIDPQRMVNYWRTTATELVALAPRVPFIGPKNAFKTDLKRWNTANKTSHPFLEYDGAVAPSRQPLDSGASAGALQEALNASDDMKAVMGLYDASLGARSNETSGVAINARKREGDVSTFHFSDNEARAIRHTGRVLIDLIPHYYNAARVIRVRGEDGTDRSVTINQQHPKLDPSTGKPMQEPVTGPDGQTQNDAEGNAQMQAVMAMHDLTVGKYDLTVSTGPSFTTRRQEAAAEMTELIRAYPQIAPLIGDLLAKNLDWPGAEEIAERLKRMVPPQALGSDGGLPPQLQQFMQQGQAMIQTLTKQVDDLKSSQAVNIAKVQQADEASKRTAAADAASTEIDGYKARTERLGVIKDALMPLITPPPITQSDAPQV